MSFKQKARSKRFFLDIWSFSSFKQQKKANSFKNDVTYKKSFKVHVLNLQNVDAEWALDGKLFA